MSMPHSQAMGNGLFELRPKEREGCPCFLLYEGRQADHYSPFVYQEDKLYPKA